jgi:hypothetical protein
MAANKIKNSITRILRMFYYNYGLFAIEAKTISNRTHNCGCVTAKIGFYCFRGRMQLKACQSAGHGADLYNNYE